MPRAIAIDFGTKRHGVAGCDPLGISVKPLPFVPAEPRDNALPALVAVVAEREAQIVVLGLPVNMDGSEGPAAATVRKFADTLRALLPENVTVVFWDERLTTHEAEKRLLERGLSHKERKQVIDSLSAAILLKSWLDERPRADGAGATEGEK